MTQKELFEMKLHQNKNAGFFLVTRVIGGWIYSRRNSMVFVPEIKNKQ